MLEYEVDRRHTVVYCTLRMRKASSVKNKLLHKVCFTHHYFQFWFNSSLINVVAVIVHRYIPGSSKGLG